MAFDYSKYDRMFNSDTMRGAGFAEASGDYPEIPDGKYECDLIDMELTESKSSHLPMIKAQFEIIDGDFKGNYIYICKMVTDKMDKRNVSDVAKANSFLKSLDSVSDEDIHFESMRQYDDLVLKVFDEAKKQNFSTKSARKHQARVIQTLGFLLSLMKSESDSPLLVRGLI